MALSEAPGAPVLRVRFGGEVPNDGSCLWTAVVRAAGLTVTPRELRHRVVKRVLADAGAGLLPRDTDTALANLHSPDIVRRSREAFACFSPRNVSARP